tara:strand:- start:850 stop:1629 length:780 start_codon:yes stop_codon:yes gene_type:complete
MTWFDNWSGRLMSNVQSLGRAGIFLLDTLKSLLRLGGRTDLLISQVYFLGVMSVSVIAVAGLFVGMMLGFQGYYSLTTFGAESSLGLAITLFLTRELSPVLTALLFAGRAGSSMVSEIGLMRVTQQLSAMEMMAVNPVDRVIAPRFVAALIAVPILTALFTVFGMLGGYIVGVSILDVNSGMFWASIEAGIDFSDDILSGMIKSVVFGFVISWISVFLGYHVTSETSGVSKATTKAVVLASVVILGLDYVMTAIMFNEV